MSKVLIRFMSNSRVANVASSILMEPELLVPVGCGTVLSDQERNQLNYFFHLKGLPTVLTDPVSFVPFETESIVKVLEKVLRKYEKAMLTIDLTDADPYVSYALGIVMRGHKEWRPGIISLDMTAGEVRILRTPPMTRRLYFPTMSAAEFRFLRDGTLPDEPLYDDVSSVLFRKDLDRVTVASMRTLSRLYYDRPTFWLDFAKKFEQLFRGQKTGEKEYRIASGDVRIRDDAFSELVANGIMTKYSRKDGVHELSFPDTKMAELIKNVANVPLMNVFLTTALAKDYSKRAAYHDLCMVDYEYVAAIRGMMPVVLSLYRQGDSAMKVYAFSHQALSRYGDPVRRILVTPPELPLDPDVRSAASATGVEMVAMNRLSKLLEPR